MVTDPELTHKVTDLVTKLPPMPESIEHILRAGLDAKEARQRIEQIIRRDPGVCTELLHLANTSCYGAGRKIDTVEEALDSVGIEPLIELIGVSYAQSIIRQEFTAMQYLDDYFTHSREIARTCRILADVTESDDHQRRMFSVAGLIHDVGRLIILLASNKTSAPLLGTTWDEMVSVVEDERQVLGLDHCEVGRNICRKWDFSGVLQDGVLRHHSPIIDCNISHCGALIFIAHFVSASDFTGDILHKMLPHELLENVNLTPEKFNQAKDLYAEELLMNSGGDI